MALFYFFMISAVTYLFFTNRRLSRDVNNLYSSRDSLWREHDNEVQARKRRDSLLRRRIHILRSRLGGKISIQDLKDAVDG